MRTTNATLEMYRHVHPSLGGSPRGSMFGYFVVPVGRVRLNVIACDGPDWEHVSVSLPDRVPTWDEMHAVKRLFWKDSETAVQFHPRQSSYVNLHPNCLHLWRRCGSDFDLPPVEYV